MLKVDNNTKTASITQVQCFYCVLTYFIPFSNVSIVYFKQVKYLLRCSQNTKTSKQTCTKNQLTGFYMMGALNSFLYPQLVLSTLNSKICSFISRSSFQRCYIKRISKKISQLSQENTCVGVFLIKLRAGVKACNFIKT